MPSAAGLEPEGEAHQLGEEQDRHAVARLVVAVHLALVGVDVHLAHGADRGHGALPVFNISQ